ncbi:Integrator complex subunit 9 [Mortierella alpina]|uniref:Integrator complex subunit 9 n=1 Tax=Mortierella alpina TaxID=64518 RepID=A0A9P6LZ73_MORAP|nr:Integrator complex subunit 9 [Mortierella alpina]
MRLTSLLPDGEPNCMVLKLRQMLILLDCGLGQEQIYAMPVREGGLTEEHKESNVSTTAGSDSRGGALKRKPAPADTTDIRQDWAAFLKSSSTQFQPKKRQRFPEPVSSGATEQAHSSQPSSTGEYMFKLPDFSGVDLKAIDVVLISNHNHILALPYLTEFTDFQGRIFATEPTIEFGRQLMTEFVTFFGTSVTSSPHQVIDRKKLMARAGSGLYPAYTHADIKACIDKIQPVRFREHIIAYFSSSSTHSNLHPDPLDGTLLEHASTVVVADLCPRGSIMYNNGMSEVCAHVAQTIARKGNVLIPCTISGFIFDLLEDIHLHLNNMGLVQQVQYSFVSPVADTALQYSNILAEWMAPRKQEMVYLPEAPLLHGILLEKGPAKNYKSVHGAFASDLKYPCIAFGGHPSLRSGPIVNLLHMWGKKANNSIIFIGKYLIMICHEPRIDVPASLEPYEGLEISKSICPLDTRLSIDQLVDLMRRYRHPKHVLVPTRAAALTKSDGTVELSDTKGTTSTPALRWSSYNVGESVQLGMASLYENVLLSEELAKGIFPQSFGSTSIASVAGSLSIYNNQMQLEAPSVAGRQLLSLHTQRQLRGVMNLQNLLAGLAMVGVISPTVTESGGDLEDDGMAESETKSVKQEIKVEFELEGKPACIIVREDETIVKCEESARPLLREPILKCFLSL